MSVGLPSDEVAEDYKNSLEDLTLNSRYEISNLTVIAKENTEHALAISRVLENHIRNTPPERKLPALYVLDSVVKNVGTPYTLFLGRNLYSIFMNAYSLVNLNVRRKLDEMLKTWKEPVPGSLDQRPVFPPDTTRHIENALIKARTAAIQEQQQQAARTQRELMARQRQMATPNTQWRSTPTPPQANSRYYPPSQQGFPLHTVSNGQYQVSKYRVCVFSVLTTIFFQQISQPPQMQYHPPPQVPQPQQQPYRQPISYPQQTSPPQHQFDSLNRDIADLVRTTKEQIAANVYDHALQGRLQALVALQNIMSQQQLPPDQLQAVRNQINALSAPPTTLPNQAPYVPPPQSIQPQHPQPPLHGSQPAPSPAHHSLQASSGSRNLADIIARAQRAPATPPVPQVSLPQPQHTSTSQAQAPLVPNDLSALLRAHGYLAAGANTPVNGSLGDTPPSTFINTSSILPLGTERDSSVNHVELTSASLKK